MNEQKSVGLIYLLWSLIIISAFFIVYKAVNGKSRNSVVNKFERLNQVIDGNTEVP